MAELESKYVAETLDSCQLLALLFVCESTRKKLFGTMAFGETDGPTQWPEFLDRFAARLSKLPEPERVYLLGSHLQSAEEIDIYSNAIIRTLLDMHRDLLARLTQKLRNDPRFA